MRILDYRRHFLTDLLSAKRWCKRFSDVSLHWEAPNYLSLDATIFQTIGIEMEMESWCLCAKTNVLLLLFSADCIYEGWVPS